MKKLTFGEALSAFFHNFLDYFIVFCILLGIGFVMGIISIIPFIGWVIAFLFTYFCMFANASIALSIAEKKTFDLMDIYEKVKEISLHPNKNVFSTLWKLVLSIFLIIVGVILYVTFFAIVLMSGTANLFTSFLGILSVMLFFVIAVLGTSIIASYFQVKITYQIMDQLMGFEGFYEEHKNDYKYSFLWCFVPILNLIVPFVLCIQYRAHVLSEKDNKVVDVEHIIKEDKEKQEETKEDIKNEPKEVDNVQDGETNSKPTEDCKKEEEKQKR